VRIPLPKSRRGRLFLGVVGLLVAAVPAAAVYYEGAGSGTCASCHEIQDAIHAWEVSSHRSLECKECHGGLWTLDVEFHLGNVRRLVNHVTGNLSERVMLKERDVTRISERCRNCHQAEFADWESGPHGVKYPAIFLVEEHNRTRLLMDDCLRCHGMYFDGGIGDLVAPLTTTGPWRLLTASASQRPAIPCLACHRIHTEGQPRQRPPEPRTDVAADERVQLPSMGFYDRRGQRHVGGGDLPMPEMHEGARKVVMSPDARQGLCYQCHAPLSSSQVRSGDDRTCIGVHEGLSCLACHSRHGKETRASCASCHPRLSNCGLDVETMDTTFRSRQSKNNVHFVKCIDCHAGGVPPRRRAEPSGAGEGAKVGAPEVKAAPQETTPPQEKSPPQGTGPGAGGAEERR